MSAPSLIAYLVHIMIAPVTRKGFFSGEHVLFAEYLSQAQSLYETSAVLGYIYRDRLDTFAGLFSEPGRQAEMAHFFVTSTLVAERLGALPNEPRNFFDVFWESEGKNLMKKMHAFGVTRFSDWLDFPKVCRLKMPIKYYFARLEMYALEGIQLGSQHPELTEKLFSYEYDAEKWRFMYESGLKIGPLPPKTVPLRERQSDARALIRPYVEKTRSDLLEKLGL